MAVMKNATPGDNCVPGDQYTAVFAPAVKDGHIETVLRARLLRSRRLARKVLLAAATLSLLTIAAVVILIIAMVTVFRAGRLYAEVMAKWFSRAVLRMWGVRVEVHQEQPFSETQTIYVSNHSSTLDMFVMVALGLPNTRFVGAEDLGGFLRWMAPLGIISYVMGTLWAPPWSKPADRARWFQRTEFLLRRTGGSIYLSPEGERVTTGRLGRFNQDNFQLAANLGAPIVPFYIDIPREIDPGKGFDTLPGTVHVYVQPAISTHGWTPENLESNTEMVRDIFVKIQKELRA
jgi:1-acyl-sn-glycerol-3-phosphate acyltransferase